MELTNEQHQALEKWVNEGLSLSDIQAHLNDHFALSLTYMEVRFLVDDLNLTLQEEDTTSQPDDSLGKTGSEQLLDSPENLSETGVHAANISSEIFDDKDDIGSTLAVDVDRITKPGSIVSGNVKFSDGVSSAWFIDQFGRLGLNPSQEGYEPSAEDLEVFQKQLQIALQKHGI